MSGIQSLDPRVRNLLLILAVAMGYFALARLSLEFAFQNSNATPLWPPSGFAFAIILLLGYRVAPGIAIGAFAVNVAVFLSNKTTNIPNALWVSGIISIGNTAEALAGYYLLKKMGPKVNDNNYSGKVNHVFIFLLVTVIMCLVSSFAGATAILLGKIITKEHYAIAWLTWWLGDVSGILLFTPFILIWVNFFEKRTDSASISRKERNVIETVALFFLVVLTSEIVFNNWIFTFFIFRWAFWIIPVVVWASIRFKQHETITAILLCSVIAVTGTINGNGPFANSSSQLITTLASNESLLILQAFISIVAITALALNASVNEQKQTEVALRSMTDHLDMRVKERTAELEQAHEQLKKINYHLSEAQRSAHIGSWEWDVPRDFVSWSDELYRIYGFAPKEFEPGYKNFLQQVHPADRDHVNETVQQTFNNHQPFSFYHRIVRPDGEIRMLYAHGEVFTDDKGNVLRMAGTGQDVTELKKSEQLLKASEKKFRDLLESAPDAIIIVNEKGIIDLVNAQTEKLFDYERWQLIGKPIEFLIPDRFQSSHIVHRENFFAHAKTREMGIGMELFAKKSDGKEIPVEISLSPLQTEGRLLVSVDIREITEKKKAQAAFIEAEKLAAKSAMSNTIAHEIRNPLTSISLSLNILNEKLASMKNIPDIEASLNIISRNYNRIDKLVKDLLYADKSAKTDFQQINLAEAMEEVLKTASDRISLNGIFVERNFEKDCIIFADKESLKIALLNIIVNAIEAMEKHEGRLKVSVAMQNKTIVLSVSDNGSGMTQEETTRMFEPYYSKKPSGFGVGLANVQTILKNHHARTEVKSEPGKGTLFIIFFDRA